MYFLNLKAVHKQIACCGRNLAGGVYLAATQELIMSLLHSLNLSSKFIALGFISLLMLLLHIF